MSALGALRKPKPTSKRHKTAHWTQQQKLQAVSTYLMLGNMVETAAVTGISINTLNTWRYQDWFKEFSLKLQAEDVQEMDSKMKRIVGKALKAVEDRIDLGDAQYDQRTGDIVRVPVKAHVALKISTELLTKRERLNDKPVKQEIEKTIDDRLAKLSEEFARFAGMKQIDVQGNIVDQP